MSGFQDIGFGMEGGFGSQAIGPCLPVRMPNGLLVIGSVSQVAGFGLRGNGDNRKPLTLSISPQLMVTIRQCFLASI